MKVLFSDNHLLAIDKPAGLLTQSSGTSQANLEDMAKEWLKAETGKPGNVFLVPVHRIDKSVSGIVLFARTSKAVTRLNESIAKRRTQKIYVALVEGRPPSSEGIIEDYLIHDDYRARRVDRTEPGAKYARLAYKLLKTEGDCSLLEIELDTGRYHQIRVQLAGIGCPIVGDTKYGSRLPWKQGAIALHHTRFVFPHPISKRNCEINSPASFL